MPATKTVNPLHFEDLEPHRFEDLVRQVAYNFRPWRSLEATGRAGQDGGTDIRGVEMTTSRDDPDDGSADDIVLGSEREWRIQVKRYRRIGPSLIEKIVQEAVPDSAGAPHGLIVAAACDVSSRTLAAFRNAALARGVSEAHVWSSAHLEDALFRPENDHLLFAYFGLSLQTRSRSRLAQVRTTVAIKRKLFAAFESKSIAKAQRTGVVIRDIDDVDYPKPEAIRGVNLRTAPWQPAEVEAFYGRGLAVERFSYDGWVKAGKGWDIDESTRQPLVRAGHDYWRELGFEPWRGRTDRPEIPEAERATLREVWFLPYDHILEVDPRGDLLMPCPHLFCRFAGEEGPFVSPRVFVAVVSRKETFLSLDARRPLFKRASRRRAAVAT